MIKKAGMIQSKRPPVAMFVYGRPDHTQRTLEALAANRGAAETDLVVYSDGARNDADRPWVKAVRSLVPEVRGFRSVRIIERPRNVGLASNIVDGVSEMMREFGRAIVIEDDIVTARGFLDFMQAGLTDFAADDRIWHISGWIYDIDPDGLPDFMLWPVMNCWGWATWADRWRHYVKDPERICREWTRDQIAAFNVDGKHDFFSQIEDNRDGRINTWAIFWYATIFEHRGLCLSPTRPFIQNIGLDGSGEHCGDERPGAFDIMRDFDGFANQIGESIAAVARIRARIADPPYRRALRSLRRSLRMLA